VARRGAVQPRCRGVPSSGARSTCARQRGRFPARPGVYAGGCGGELPIITSVVCGVDCKAPARRQRTRRRALAHPAGMTRQLSAYQAFILANQIGGSRAPGDSRGSASEALGRRAAGFRPARSLSGDPASIGRLERIGQEEYQAHDVGDGHTDGHRVRIRRGRLPVRKDVAGVSDALAIRQEIGPDRLEIHGVRGAGSGASEGRPVLEQSTEDPFL